MVAFSRRVSIKLAYGQEKALPENRSIYLNNGIG
jgi:hypothetical protein